jgi:GR25 family glycosyltransferase involved in LPS biosynthesis
MYRGYFLNLQRNEQRRNALLKNLAETGASARYERWEAVDGRAAANDHPTKLDPGNLGLWLSHEQLLQSAPSDKHIHILEDDAVLGKNAVEVLDGMLAHLDASVPTWDLLFTDTFVQPRTDVFVLFLQKMREFAKTRSYAVVDLANIPFACTSSMLINK